MADSKSPPRNYPDLHDHLKALDERGLLVTVDREINKDTELHPLVRWQFRGGIEEKDRKAFLFNNVVDSKGRKFDVPVAVGVLAASRDIYRTGIGCELDEIEETWNKATANPIDPVEVTNAPCQEIVWQGFCRTCQKQLLLCLLPLEARDERAPLGPLGIPIDR